MALNSPIEKVLNEILNLKVFGGYAIRRLTTHDCPFLSLLFMCLREHHLSRTDFRIKMYQKF